MAESASDQNVPQDVLDELSNASSPPLPQLSLSSASEEDDKYVAFLFYLDTHFQYSMFYFFMFFYYTNLQKTVLGVSELR